MTRWIPISLIGLFTGAFFAGACGSSSGSGPGGEGTDAGDGDGDSSGDGDVSGDGDGDGDGDSPGDGSGSGTTDGDGIQIVQAPIIPGGGSNAAPLSPGCGPETAQECTTPGGGCDNGELLDGGSVEVKDAGAVCFFGEGIETPSATVEHITEVVDGKEYVHLRVIFDPDFVDTTYGECSIETGWNPKRPHTFKDLRSSDHTELILYNCDDELSMHVKVDFAEEGIEGAGCDVGTAGVTGGDGEVIVGDVSHVLAVGTSLARNMNGCGYCDKVESPCPGGDGYEPSPDVPEWDFRMVYELWIDADAFGDSGFCHPDIEYVHASPSKASSDTILVEPEDCPPPGDDDDCPPNYELYLSSEGEYLCAGPPNDGGCETGYEIDLTSEGELCIPIGEQ